MVCVIVIIWDCRFKWLCSIIVFCMIASAYVVLSWAVVDAIVTDLWSYLFCLSFHFFCTLATVWLCMKSHQVVERWMMKFKRVLFLLICLIVKTQQEQRQVADAFWYKIVHILYVPSYWEIWHFVVCRCLATL